jgi:hypothetical protein
MGGRTLALTLAGALALEATLASQQQAPLTFRSSAELVRLHVVVRDGQGRPVPGLTKDDFALLDSKQPRAIELFEEVSRPAAALPSPIVPAVFPLDVADNRTARARVPGLPDLRLSCRRLRAVPVRRVSAGAARGGRRMTERAPHLVDYVLPDVPVRQWVLTLPSRVRYAVARTAGKELFYLTPGGKMMSVAVTPNASNGTLDFVPPVEMFQSPWTAPNLTIDLYSVTKDGERLLFIRPRESTGVRPPVTVVINWAAGLTRP